MRPQEQTYPQGEKTDQKQPETHGHAKHAAHSPPPAETVHDRPLPPLGGPTPLPRGTETVLVVEDETTVMTLINLVLGQLGYTVLAATDPAEAVRADGQHAGPIHLLLTDVRLPHTTGPQLAGQLAVSRPGLRVLYLSGLAQAVLLEKGLLAPGSAVLEKPFKLDVLAAKVREVLGR